MAKSWSFEWVTAWDDVWSPGFVADWDKLSAQSPDNHLFFESSMARAWVNAHREAFDLKPVVAVARHVSGCRALLPLVYGRRPWKEGWQRLLLPMGHDRYDCHDPIFSQPCEPGVIAEFWQDLFDAVAASFSGVVDVLYILRVSPRYATPGSGFFHEVESPYLDLTAVKSVGDLFTFCAKRFRSDLERQERRLQKMGEVRLRVFGPDELPAAREALHEFIAAHRVRWAGEDVPVQFYEEFAANCLSNGLLHMSVLEVGEQRMSWCVSFYHKRRFYYYKPTFDMTMKAYSPGRVHLFRVMQDALARGATVFDFLRGAEEYKLEWTKTSMELFHLRRDIPGARHRAIAGLRRTMGLGRPAYRLIMKKLLKLDK